jgi:DNA-binding XRE family transcriptional regulator
MAAWTLEFYTEDNGRIPVEEFIDSLDKRERAAVQRDLDALAEFGLDAPFVRPIEGSLWEIKKEQRGMPAKTVPYEEVKARILADPEVRRYYDEMEPAYQLLRLRLQRGLTQKQLAEQVGTTQSSIARLESGRAKPSLSTLERVAQALGGRVIVKIEAKA